MMSLKSSITKLVLFALALLSPIKVFLVLVGLFIFIDTILGIWASVKTGIKIESRKLSKFISKLLVYNSVVILAYMLDKFLLGEFFLLFLSVPLAITKLTSIGLIINEAYSMDEKVRNVKGVGIYDVFKKLLGLAKYVKKQKEEIL